MQNVETSLAHIGLNSDYYSTLAYFTIQNDQQLLDEKLIKEKIQQTQSLPERIQDIYVLNGNRQLLIVSKSSSDVNRIETSILTLLNGTYTSLVRADVPLTNSTVPPVLLISNLSDSQLRFFNEDKHMAVKYIEGKTGLTFKVVDSSFYLTGLLFQFLILNDLFSENNKVLGEISQNVPSERKIESDAVKLEKIASTKGPHLEWSTLYEESQVKGYFRIKPKQENEGENDMPDVYYEIYMFVADMTDLNTDGLTNAANPNLHPGYVGDGIARRIREKAGKQMQDACKRILRQEHNNELIQEGEVVLTKASGKLKSKYVLHAVAPTWTKHILNSPHPHESRSSSPASSLSSMTSSLTSSPTASTSSASTCIGEKFEYLMDKTFANILQQAHDPKLQLSSLALPVSSNVLGGAFDLPVELCAHSLYTQLCDFKANKSTCLKTFCITSCEPDTVKILCDIFGNYTDNYSESSWAMPLSPMTRLVSEALLNRPQPEKNDEAKENKEIFLVRNDNMTTQKENSNFTSEENLLKNTDMVTLKTINDISVDKSYTQNNTDRYSVHQRDRRAKPHTENKSIDSLNKKLDNLTVTIQIKDDKKSMDTNEGQCNSSGSSTSSSRLITMDEDTIANIKYNRQNKPRTVSNSSSSYSSEGGFDKSRLNFNTRASENSSLGGGSMPTNTTNYFKSLEMKSRCDSSCLFCQRENKAKLVACGNDNCKGVYCHNCILNYFQNQKTPKCPSCRLTLEPETINNLKERYSSSPEPVKLMSIQSTGHNNHHSNDGVNTHHLNNNNNINKNNTNFNYNRLKLNSNNHNTNHSQNHNQNHSHNSYNSGHSNSSTTSKPGHSGSKHAITQAKVYVRVLDEPCHGYEKFKTLMVTFELEDGIQNSNHPRPGLPYKGTTKKVYLPEIPEHREILAFYEKALHTGRLFKIAFSRNYDDYRVLLNQDVLLKTSQHGGGRFGYPDYNYVKDILYMARNCK